MKTGGFPRYIKDRNGNYPSILYENIIYKDVVTRNKLTLLIQFASKNDRYQTYGNGQNGLIFALNAYSLTEGIILTDDETEEITIDNKKYM